MSVATLTEMFLNTVKAYSSKIALMRKVEGQYQGITYKEFGENVRNLALGLASLGVKKGDRVALLSENRVEWPFSDLAILSLGAINVPIYPTLIPKQIEYILNDSEAKIIIVSKSDQTSKITEILKNLPVLKYIIYMESPSTMNDKMLSFQQLAEKGQEFGNKHPDYYDQTAKAVTPDDPAGIIYTSGTTGNPKGVILTHNNILSNVNGGVNTINIVTDDTFLSFLPLCHVLERTGGQFVPISVGATIAYAENIDTVAQNLGEVKPTIMIGVPRFFEKMYSRVLETAKSGGAAKQKIFNWAFKIGAKFVKAQSTGKINSALKLKHNMAHKLVFSKLQARVGGRLRFFVSGGAPLSREIGEFFHNAGIKILEGYGLTESSPIISLSREDKFKFGAVGPVLEKVGVEVKIADDGEILTRGPHVMKGYYKKPAETKEVIDADSWLHTGDIGFLDNDGLLVITDRKKNIIVTSSGKNIPPAPIENLLLTSPLIDQIVIIGDKRKFLSALIVPNFEAIQSFAQEQNIQYKDNAELVSHPKIYEYINNEIERLSSELARFEQLKAFRLMSQPFTIEAGELTPTLKIKRKVVEEKYADLIKSMYKD